MAMLIVIIRCLW